MTPRPHAGGQGVAAGQEPRQVLPMSPGCPGRSYGLQERAFPRRGRGRGGRISAGSVIYPTLRASACGGLLSAGEANRVPCGFFYDGIDHEKILGVLVRFPRALRAGPGDIYDSARIHRQFNRKYNSGFKNQAIGLNRACVIQPTLSTDIHRIDRNNRMVTKGLDRAVFGKKDFTSVSAEIEQHLGGPPNFPDAKIDREVIAPDHKAMIAADASEVSADRGSAKLPSLKEQEFCGSLRAQEFAGGGGVVLGCALVVHESNIPLRNSYVKLFPQLFSKGQTMENQQISTPGEGANAA